MAEIAKIKNYTPDDPRISVESDMERKHQNGRIWTRRGK